MFSLEGFEQFLLKKRKRNGEKYLDKTIEFYVRFIGIHWNKLLILKDDEESFLDYAKELIKKYPHNNYRASIKLFLLYVGYDKNSDLIKGLPSPERRASAINSERVLVNKVIPKNDLEFLFDELPEEWELVFRVLYDTAFRKSEFLSIRGKDVDFTEDGTIGATIQVIGKGGKRRTGYLTKKTTKLFKKLKGDVKPNDKVFVFYKDAGYTPYARQGKYLYDRVVKITKLLLGKEYTVHCLRHTRASHLAEHTDVLGVSSYLSHSSLAVTNVYVKASTKLGKKAFQEAEK